VLTSNQTMKHLKKWSMNTFNHADNKRSYYRE
jgi:hypothetical protein